ncbi:aldehyde oxidase GLOX-like [Silene latifolia]|uniref:aldehyde oxidase GLOX-like n=1 Tax=Silene latifolia TaxID=37657 RepID=UPI003D780AC5
MSTLSFLIIFFSLLILLTVPTSATFPEFEPLLGWWTLLHRSIGISAMHMQLLYNDQVVIFDRTDFGPSNLTLPFDKCRPRYYQNGTVSRLDCTAHSVLYDVVSNTYRPLTVLTDTWCSSGSVDPNGRLVQTGGYARGERVIRTFSPCNNNELTCDWDELRTNLAARRWYASNHILPNGRVIVVGGRGSPNYEFYPSQVPRKYPLRFLSETWDGRNKENNLYPFLHLLPNNHLFIFANNRSIEFNYMTGTVVKEFPIMPSGDRRNYPSTGSSTLLPIIGENLEILVCGGAKPGSFDLANVEGVYVAASMTCGRMVITDPNPHWMMEEMPMSRVMPDMVMLPTGDILIINGAGNGTAGWENADNPVLNPVLYRVSAPDPTQRFIVLNPTKIPRLYHSSAILLSDGRVLVGGSNPHPTYNFTREAKFPTELSLETFHPPYLDPLFGRFRPSILAIETEGKVVNYGQMVAVNFVLGEYLPERGLAVTMILPPFTTHSFGMNQRLVILGAEGVIQLSEVAYKVTVRMPVNVNVALPGYYMLFVVHAGVPSHGVWVQLKPSVMQ